MISKLWRIDKMNWKEFKEFIEKQGVTDEMDVDYIDVNGYESAEDMDVEIDDTEFNVI
jgi:hypothetical protein